VEAWATGGGSSVDADPLGIVSLRSTASRVHLGSSKVSSGIGFSPLFRGKASRRCRRKSSDHGTKDASSLYKSMSPRYMDRVIRLHPSSCCSSASPRGYSSFAPSWVSRLCSFRAAQLNLHRISTKTARGHHQILTLDMSYLLDRRS